MSVAAVREPDPLTVAVVVERMLVHQGNRQTAASYRSKLRPLLALVGDRPANALTRAEWAALEDELADDRGKRAARSTMQLVERALRAMGIPPASDPLTSDPIRLDAAARKHRAASRMPYLRAGKDTESSAPQGCPLSWSTPGPSSSGVSVPVIR